MFPRRQITLSWQCWLESVRKILNSTNVVQIAEWNQLSTPKSFVLKQRCADEVGIQPDRQQVIFWHTLYNDANLADILHKTVVSCNVLSTRRSPFELVTWFADDNGL